MANEEKELYKFINDSKYRDKVIAKLHRNEDAAYDKRIKQIEYEKSLLNKKKTNEITRISKAGWEKIAGGKIILNQSAIKDDELSNFEYETKFKVYYNMPAINDRAERLLVVDKLLLKLGFGKQGSTSFFGLFK